MEERIYRSPAPEIEIPKVSLTEHVIGRAAARGDHPAIVSPCSPSPEGEGRRRLLREEHGAAKAAG
jgi:hypothetical protein